MHARALTLIKDSFPCANTGPLNCTFLASHSAIAPTLADYERPLRCIQLCQPLASVVLSQQPKEASSLHLPPPVSSPPRWRLHEPDLVHLYEPASLYRFSLAPWRLHEPDLVRSCEPASLKRFSLAPWRLHEPDLVRSCEPALLDKLSLTPLISQNSTGIPPQSSKSCCS